MAAASPEHADLIVIGSGQGGVPLATALAHQGKRVVLFERGPFGGSCINVGCTPSKSFLASAHTAGRARAAVPLGVHADVRVDQRAVFERLRRIRTNWSGLTERRLRDAGVEIVPAEARFVDVRTLAGGGRTIRADRVVIDTGTSPLIPDIAGLRETPVLTNLTFFDQIELPDVLLVLGGGYIGLELGQGARRIGSAVTIVHGHDRLLEREEPDVSSIVQQALQDDGVRFVLNATVTSVARENGRLCVHLADGQVLEGNALLVATGRTPNTAALDLAASGIDCSGNGSVRVDDYLQTTCPGVYALGDVAGQPAFTHVSFEDHRRLLSTFAGSPRRRDDRVLSYAMFTEPQVGRTGHTEASARAAGIAARSVTLPLSEVARATEWNLLRGFFRLVVDERTDRIIGATFVSYEAGELIHVMVAHIEAQATWHVLERSMYIHPTLAEGLPSLAELLTKAPNA
ncbi:MAG: FAD-dependent oxidoreductase [Candidatus Eremiobacteraeota bacterium]|nr:FAD-dependent oxidoreductase [Candidatus Eremiobacteraeota bacterium]